MVANIEDVTNQVSALAGAWEQFKSVNDTRLKEIEKKGDADSLFQPHLEKINLFMDEQKAALDQHAKDVTELKTAMNRASAGTGDTKAVDPLKAQHKEAFLNYVRKGRDNGLADLETKALSVQSDPDGGYLVPPEMNGRIVTRIFDTSPIRQIANTVTISTDALEGLRDTDEASAGWVAETGSRTATNTPQVGTYRIPTNELYAAPTATQKLLDDGMLDVESWLAMKIADKFARLENTAFVSGTGVGQPQGFTKYTMASTDDGSRAWGQLQYVGTGNAGDFASSNGGDVLFDLIQKFKAGYLNNATWVAPRAVIAKVRKLKDGQGRYLWEPALQAGQPNTLLGYTILMAEDMPALASGSLSLAFGNFAEGYQIVDRVGIRTLRDPYSSKPNVIFYSTKRTGGGVVQSEAIKFVKFS